MATVDHLFATNAGPPGDPQAGGHFETLSRLLRWLGKEISRHDANLKEPGGHLALLNSARSLVAEREHAHNHDEQARSAAIAAQLAEVRDWLSDNMPTPAESALRHLEIITDFILTNAAGALRDGLLSNPEQALPSVNELDYRTWLLKHGARPATVGSALVGSIYDMVFAYPQGDATQNGKVEAGSIFISLTRSARYQDFYLWKMMAGTGDVVAAPLYEVLRRRGVNFKFFHRVTALQPNDTNDQIETVRISKQVNVIGDHYQPLVDVKGLPCWPDQPSYEQIVEGKKLRDEHIDLESHWTPWTDTGGEVVLAAGRDYDVVILGTSLAPLSDIASECVARNSSWSDMLNHVETVQTQSVQFWFRPDLEEINDNFPTGLVVNAYDNDEQPLSTWADISEILPAEQWPDGAVGNESIICGPMRGPTFPPPASDAKFPQHAAQQLAQNLEDFLQNNGAALWPRLYSDGKFDQAKLVSEYQRVNIDPSERYVLTLPGTTKYRLRAQDSGYANLFLTGDWTQNGHNLGSFEASFTSGKLTARAISGQPSKIEGIADDSSLYDQETRS